MSPERPCAGHAPQPSPPAEENASGPSRRVDGPRTALRGTGGRKDPASDRVLGLLPRVLVVVDGFLRLALGERVLRLGHLAVRFVDLALLATRRDRGVDRGLSE